MTSFDRIGSELGSERASALPFCSTPTVETSSRQVVNVASVKHRSPFRYPGGKTWLVPRIKQWLSAKETKIKRLVEPFAGGGIVSLSALFEGLVESICLIEKDHNVGSVWQTVVLGGAPDLAERIIRFELTEDNVVALLNEPLEPDDILGRAFATIVRNRVQRGGIMAPGAGLVRNGENGRGLASRWYPQTLKNRLIDLHSVHSQIEFRSGDGIKFMTEHGDDSELGWFLDPPYTVAGRRLYLHSELDHGDLFKKASDLSGSFLMTYDNTPQIQEFADEYGLEKAEVSMKNTHHSLMSELLISRNLNWIVD